MSSSAPAPSGPVLPHTVVVHPLVLLSVVDHFNRVAKGTTDRRVVGVLLGETYKGKIDVTNSYAVPFDEDRKDPTVWFLDHNYHEDILGMFRKVSSKEKVVGWYSTGPKIRPADIEINELMRKYCLEPVLVIIDVNPVDELTIPTEAYRSVENSAEEISANRKTFVHIQSSVGAFEAEEVGVEQLLRDIRDTTVSTLASEVTSKLNSLKGLEKHLREIHGYLNNVLDGNLPQNHQILYNLQDIFNLSPNLRVDDIVKSFTTKTNDSMLVIYLSSLIRSIVALHDLINNKLANKEAIKKKHELLAAKKQEKADKAAEKEKVAAAEKEKEKEKDKAKPDSPRSS